jgi:hypothetical protein
MALHECPHCQSRHRKIILYSVPGKDSFYRRLGLRRMSTALAIFRDEDRALAQGYLSKG